MVRVLTRTSAYLWRLSKFIGPGFMIAVGYLDPGNWATDMQAGSSYGYQLLFIVLVSNIIAMFLQNLTIRLGTVSSLDLASASRQYLPRWLNLVLYIFAEAAIIATDLAEVIGSAIAFNLLFPSLPLPAGVAITALDVFIVLLFYNEENTECHDNSTDMASARLVRFFEWFVMLLVGAVGICFMIELSYSNIVAVDLFKGFVPSGKVFTDPDCLYAAIGIIGATVMPHNLYLHSYIVQSRCLKWRSCRPSVAPVSEDGSDGWMMKCRQLPGDEQPHEKASISSKQSDQGNLQRLRAFLDTHLRAHLHYALVDLLIALTFAFFVNCAILIVASANFYYSTDGQQQYVEDLFSAHDLLYQYLGPAAATVFALALLCAGQSSTLTATLAGQIVMSGFLGMTTRPWVRRIITRLVAIVPAMVAACVSGRSGLSQMLVASQVALSVQLPFAIVPLVYFTSSKRIMKLELLVQDTSQQEAAPKRIAWVDHLLKKETWFYQRFSHSLGTLMPIRKSSTKQAESYPCEPLDRNSSLSIHSAKPDSYTEQETEKVHLSTLPDALSYPNGRLATATAILIALLLIGLNGYLVVSVIINPSL